ncbi:major facilitator superfamily domain-containing protein [Cercophora scortea]|uniref:Major facilitator superfamily domain-containing protein n=1 Tax=Cercophora scortea TaxID=314031 RepID=A0AAE0IYN1_9PEZI|nr:major facilitator superfamily domain-containing protein [Cercophora scortea]
MESQRRLNKQHVPVSHFSLVLDPAGVNAEVLDHHYPGEGTAEAPYIVDFLPLDPHNPLQFPQWKKWTITALQAIATLAVAFASTAYSGGISEVIRDFRIGTEVAILGISLFVLGFAIGPVIWAPLSEFYGRQFLFFFTYMALTAFNAGAAGAQNIETLIILRFFGGAFGSSPMTNSGGVIADMFQANERGLASCLFATAPFLGPSIGPIVGGFLGQAEGWRWVEGLMAIFTGVLWVTCSLFVPETYAPVLLRKRAVKLSQMTGKVYLSKLDQHNTKTKGEQIKTAMLRPWILLFTEPIVLLTSVYMAIVYGTLYLMFAAFPIVFQVGRHWSPGVGGLAFIGVAIGMMLGVLGALHDNKRYVRVAMANGGVAPPEARLPPACVGSLLLPIGLFWFAWTNGPEVHWVVPIIASAFFAAGLVLVFLSLMGYLIDSYTVFAASVLASNSVLRSLFGAAFPLFTTYMYADLGIHWASTVPAFLALACVPFPFLFYRYGGQIRMKCKYAAEAAVVLARMRAGAAVVNEDEAIAEVEAHDEMLRMEKTRTHQSGRSLGRLRSLRLYASRRASGAGIEAQEGQRVDGEKKHIVAESVDTGDASSSFTAPEGAGAVGDKGTEEGEKTS